MKFHSFFSINEGSGNSFFSPILYSLGRNTADQTRRPFWIQIGLIAVENDKYPDVFGLGIVTKFVCLRMHSNWAERGLIVGSAEQDLL